MSHRQERPRRRRLGRLSAVLVVVAGIAGISGCVKGADTSPPEHRSPSATPTETAGKAEIPPDTNPPTPEIVGPVPAGFGSWTEVFDLQQRMNSAADRISTAGGAIVGLAGIVAAPEARRLTVYWKGQPPAETLRLIDGIRADLPVDVLPARHSATELAEVSRSVVTKRGVVSVGGNVDGSGITVTVSGDVNVADWGIDVPATLKLGEQPFLIVCSRHDDCAPRWGGATYWSPSDVCTLGFTVWKNGTSPGGQKSNYKDDYMLSAGHCAELNDVATTPDGAFVGNVVADDDDRDTLLIKNPVLNQFESRIFTGTWNAMTGYNRQVMGSFGNYVGAYVCTSGSYTGEHCNLKVDAIDLWISPGGDTIGALVRATNTSGGVAVGKGDSGGPVYVPVKGAAFAMGTMTAASSVVACPAGSPSSKCGSSVYYVDIAGALDYYQATIATGPGFVWPTYSPPS